MGKNKGKKKRQENPEGSAQATEQQQLESSQSQSSQQQSIVRGPAQGSESVGDNQRAQAHRQATVPSQSSTAIQQPASASINRPELSTSVPGENMELAAEQPAQASSEISASTTSAETKIKGKGRGGGLSVQPTGTTILPMKEQPIPAETASKKKRKGKNEETQKPTASAAPALSTSGVGGIVTDLEKLTLKPKSESSAQPTASTQPSSTDKPAETKGKGKGRSGAQLPQQTAASTVQEKAPLKSSKTKASEKKQKDEDPAVQKAAASATSLPSTEGVGDTAAKTEKEDFTIPKRTGKICDDGIHVRSIHDIDYVEKTLPIEVNYLPLKIRNPQLKIYHYDVSFDPNTSNFRERNPKRTQKLNTPKFLLRDALEQMRLRHFSDRNPAFDGMSNMYVAGQPLKRDTIRDTISVRNPESGLNKEFDVTIKLGKGNLNLDQLFKHCRSGITSNTPQKAIQATDIALRSGLVDFTTAGRSFFCRPSRPIPLTDGMELWHGFYQSAVAAWQPYLNIDVANKAFPIEQPVLDYLRYDMNLPENVLLNGLEPRAKRRLEKFIKGLKISYKMPTGERNQFQKRVYRVTGLGGNALDERFEHEKRTIIVNSYFEAVKHYTIKYKKLPLLKYGTQGAAVPIELCTIIGNQAVLRKLNETQTSEMVRAAAKPTFERKRRIEENIRNANYRSSPILNEFGIEVQTNFEKLDAVVIKPPKISYREREVLVSRGAWTLNRIPFHQASAVPSWGILNLNRSTSKVDELDGHMRTVGSELGMNIRRHEKYIQHDGGPGVPDDGIVKYLSQFKEKKIGLVIVILADGSENYGQVKRASELQVGVLTQCLKSNTLRRINPMIVKNILLKVNSKLRGINHTIAPAWTPALFAKTFMLVGADVTHPAPGPEAELTPSIAGVAASQDKYGFQYNMEYRLQLSRQEIISELADMMMIHLQNFRAKYNRLPLNIIYFRDGVSDQQFVSVLQTELTAIKNACRKVDANYEAKVMFVVVQKRHHTRFFPRVQVDDKNGNVPAGTLVDHKITHPTEFDFYLVSHQSIQGTARPTKYHLLYDDIAYSEFNPPIVNPQFELEKLTYYLCHMFSRCTRSVSYPAPTYYAHLAAFRARAWWDRRTVNMAILREEQTNRGAISTNITNNYPMFFT